VLSEKGIHYSIEKTYDNGVRIGGVENHTKKYKKLGKIGQTWFPEDWDNNIRTAGTYASNKPAIVTEVNDDDGNRYARNGYYRIFIHSTYEIFW
jgi:hypothetical protein